MSRDQHVVFEVVKVASPFYAFRFPLHDSPAPAEEKANLVAVLTALCDVLSRLSSLYPTLWLDTKELHRDGGTRLYSRNVKLLSPFMGFALDPTGEAPREFRATDITDREWDSEIKVFMRTAIFAQNLKETLNAYDLFAGRGVATLLFFSAKSAADSGLALAAERFAKGTCDVFRPRMQDGAFQNFGFYLPLLSGRNISDMSSNELEVCLGESDVYVREASEEKEVFLIFRQNPEPLFSGLGMKRLGVGDHPVSWEFALPSVADRGIKE